MRNVEADLAEFRVLTPVYGVRGQAGIAGLGPPKAVGDEARERNPIK